MGKSLVDQFLEDCVGSACEAIAMRGIEGVLQEYHYWLKCHYPEFKEEVERELARMQAEGCEDA